jgi:hypothetical protein
MHGPAQFGQEFGVFGVHANRRGRGPRLIGR